jgi:hypothetical protein
VATEEGTLSEDPVLRCRTGPSERSTQRPFFAFPGKAEETWLLASFATDGR